MCAVTFSLLLTLTKRVRGDVYASHSDTKAKLRKKLRKKEIKKLRHKETKKQR